MLKRFRVTVDGRDFDVVVEEIVEGAGAPAVPAHPVAAAPALAAPALAAAHAPPPAAGPGAQTAPLAGVVVGLPVAVGASVAVGDVVAVVEAMKMKTEVVSGAAGVVRSIAATLGQPVEAGAVLVVVG